MVSRNTIAMLIAALTTLGQVAPNCRLAGAEPKRAGDPQARITEPGKDRDGVLVHAVQSPYQAGATQIKVLLPDRLEPGRRYRALYVLPVEPGEGAYYGNALAELKQSGLHNRCQLICVLPTFSQLPWYADHPTDPGVRQESHLLKVVVPLVESRYPVQAERAGRLLVGFSKSGWGAFSLLLRHPELFGRAAAWDAPLEEATPTRFGMGPIFGTQENFAQYRISALLTREAPRLCGAPRLILLGYGNFRTQHIQAHERMTALGVAHVYRDGPARKHHWASGWLPEAVELLAGTAAREATKEH
jgi:hypothetical protein